MEPVANGRTCNPTFMIAGTSAVEANPHCAALPTFLLAPYLNATDKTDPALENLCRAIAECLQVGGALVVRDPRVDSSLNEGFLSLMERYFSQPLESKMADVRPKLAYQVGATPEGIERPRALRDANILKEAEKLAPEHRPQPPTAADVKWRFFWRVGERPLETQYSELNAAPVTPVGFPEWAAVMDEWGGRMLETVATVAEMLARGFAMAPDTFTRRMQLGPHLLAPTGVDLDKHGDIGTVFAGYHYDLNFLTIHGKSRYPGLHIWLRNGDRIPVRIPDGCLLIQAGKQMEWLTGGFVKAGFHEVICTPETLEAAAKARNEGRPAWRVSSTVFSQIASDEMLGPLGPFATSEAQAAYPAIPAGNCVCIGGPATGPIADRCKAPAMALPDFSPRQARLERLLELVAGKAFVDQPPNPEEEALVQALLSTCTNKANFDCRSGYFAGIVTGEDMCLKLLHICSCTTGVCRALAIQALQSTLHDHADAISTCISTGVVPLLLSILIDALPSSSKDVSAAYTASVTVIVLRTLVRQGGDEGAVAFLAAEGIQILLVLMDYLTLESRSVCLILYLMNDVTRRSLKVLDAAIAAGALSYVVKVLGQPLCEASKFAALILNRWSLAAQHGEAISAAGCADALLAVLKACNDMGNDVDAETAAYALSALAIMTQGNTNRLREILLSCPSFLAAVSGAIELYERCFQGVGFPHAMLCNLLDGPSGARLLLALTTQGLLPTWLNARHSGTYVVLRATHADALLKLYQRYKAAEDLEITVAATHLLKHSHVFLSMLTIDERLENLALGALDELRNEPVSNLYRTASFSPGGDASKPGAWVTSDDEACFDNSMLASSPASLPSLPQLTVSPDKAFGHLDSKESEGKANHTPSNSSTGRCIAAVSRLGRWLGIYLGADWMVDPRPPSQRTVDVQRRSCVSGTLLWKEHIGTARYDTLCFVVGGHEVHAVGFVLETHSQFLHGLLSTVTDLREKIYLPLLAPFTPARMHRLFLAAVEWSYTGEVHTMEANEPDSMFDLWMLADFLQMDGLQRYCEAVLATLFAYRTDIVVKSMVLAEMHPSAVPLRRLIARHVLRSILQNREIVEVVAESGVNCGALAADMGAELRSCLETAAASL